MDMFMLFFFLFFFLSEMMDVNGGSISLDKIISKEYTSMCMKIADTARIQVRKFMYLFNHVIQFIVYM